MNQIANHWPIAAGAIWVLTGIWVVNRVREARKPLLEGASGNPSRDVWRRLSLNRVNRVSGYVIFGVVFICILGPWLWNVIFGITYRTADSTYSNLSPLWWKHLGCTAEAFAPARFIFGTDDHGHDLFVHVLEGGRVSIAVGLIVATIALGFGVIYGAVAGYIGGRTDMLMMRIVDALYSMPFLIIVIIIMGIYTKNIFLLFFAIGFFAWLSLARLVRGEVLRLKHMEFIFAAEACGTPDWKIILQHLVPNCLGVVIVHTTLIVPRAMFAEAFLSYIGFGIQPPLSSWGTLITVGVKDMEYSPWFAVFPVGLFIVTLLCLNFAGDGLRDAFDPRVRAFEGRRRKARLAGAMVQNDSGNVLEIGGLAVEFDDSDDRIVHAVNGINLALRRGGCLAIVGESGSGKSVTGRAVMGLNPSPPSHTVGGSVRFGDLDLLRAPERMLRRIRGGKIAMVFQDPMTALNPYLTVETQIVEAIYAHEKISRKQARVRALEMLRRVGIPEPELRLTQCPHELSGGMRQRVMIAIALVMKPEIIIADEPTTALDVTIQAQILELLRQLRRETGTAIILITHDLGIVAEMADTVAVMYAGCIVEQGLVRELLKNPRHPYTRGLLASLPRLGSVDVLHAIPGQPPDPRNLPQGCAFAERCDFVLDECVRAFPAERPVSATHVVRCVRKEAVS